MDHGLAVLIISIVGTATSFGIPRVRAAAPWRGLPLNPWGEIGDGLKRLRRDRVCGSL